MDPKNTIYVVARCPMNEPIVHRQKWLIDMTIFTSACFSTFLTVCSCHLSASKRAIAVHGPVRIDSLKRRQKDKKETIVTKTKRKWTSNFKPKEKERGSVPGGFIVDYITQNKCHIGPIAEFGSVPR